MRLLPTSRPRLPRGCRRSRPALLRDERGSAAIEFALVAAPFLLFVVGLVGIGLYFLANHSLQYGAEAAARKIRTGEAEGGRMTVGQFRELVCDHAGAFIDCGKLSVLIEHGSTWSAVTPKGCTDRNNNMVGSTGTVSEQVSKYSGTASEVVLVTLCYKWELAKYFDFLKFGSNKAGDPAILQAATAFKSEPYTP